MKNTSTSIKEKMISRYLDKEILKNQKKRTDINELLNRVKIDQKNESRKK